MKKPIEAKVQAGSLSAAASGVVLYVLQTYVFKGSLPQGIESLVYAAVPAVLAGVGAWLAPHTPRPDLKPPAAPGELLSSPTETGCTASTRPAPNWLQHTAWGRGGFHAST